MAQNSPVLMRVNKTAFEQYYSRTGLSLRSLAREVGVSHTLIHQLLTNPDKRYVSLENAAKFEDVFHAPRETVFFAELRVQEGS